MVSPTHCLVGVALFFSVFSWIVGIIAMAVPKWYVIESSDGNTDIGAFQICVPSAAGSTEKTCESVASQGFSFPECNRDSDALRARFGVVQGLGIVGIVLTVVATAILVAAFVKGCKRTRQQREEQRTARRNEPGYVPTPRNDPRPNDQRPEDQRDDIDEEEETRMPIMEIIALVLNLVGFVVFCAAAFHFLTSVKSWLFCDQSPCAYLESQGYTGCSDSIGWTFALAVIAWITALAAAICLALRWILLPSASKANSSESDEIGRPVGRQANGMPTDEELRRRDENREEYRQRDNEKRRRKEEDKHDRDQDRAYTQQQQQVYLNQAAINKFNQDAYARNPQLQQQLQPHPSPPPTQSSAAAPQVTLPEGHWEWDDESQLFWSEQQKYFYDHNSGHFYEPESKQWFNPQTNEWYTI